MPISIPNPYSGGEEETCSVSFAAQQAFVGSGPGGTQTEAEFNKSKMLGEWGVIKAKLAKGEIPNGTKVMAFTSSTGNRGYLSVKNGELFKTLYGASGGKSEGKFNPDNGKLFIESDMFDVSIPQAVSPKPKPEPVYLTEADIKALGELDPKDGQVFGVQPNGDHVKYDASKFLYLHMTKDSEDQNSVVKGSPVLQGVMHAGDNWLKPDGKASTPNATPATVTSASPTPSSPQVAAPTPNAAVNTGSTSPGSMSHEDVSAMFVKIKDDLAKEQGLNVKGANPALDALVYKAIGDKTGYTAAEVKAKIDAYKAAGNKLSALKKKVMAGTYKVPEGKNTGTAPQPTKATPAAPLNTPKATNTPVVDPKPNGVPTVATPKLANEAKAAVSAAVAADPGKVYSDEDVAAAYITAKDAIVAASNGKWTLYTKSDELDMEIAIAVGLKTGGLSPLKQKEMIASYLASGKKLSVLKKQLIKQGALKPQADTLKSKTGAAPATPASNAADVAAKAAAGYTPTPTPTVKPSTSTTTPIASPSPPTPAAKATAADAGDISGLDAVVKAQIFNTFKGTGSKSWLSAASESNYMGLISVQQQVLLAKGIDLTLLQILRVIDEEGAKKAGATNGNLFEKKVATWLTTPEGTDYIKNNEAKILKEAEEEAEAAKKAAAKKAAAEQAKKEAEEAAKKLAASQPPLPADSAQFRVKSKGWSEAFWSESYDYGDNRVTEQGKDALYYYTTNAGYTAMNGQLRGLLKETPSVKRKAKEAVAAMRPVDEPILVHRGTTGKQFGFKEVGENHLIWGITGKTFSDKGFLSTSTGGSAAFSGKPVLMEIECIPGTPMQYVDTFSRYPGENEMLLTAGVEYKVLRVEQKGSQIVVRMRVTNWPGKDA